MVKHRSDNDGKLSIMPQIKSLDGRELIKSPQISRHGEGRLSRDTAEVGRSNRPSRTIFFAEDIGLHECPYMRRWVADFSLFSVRIHRWQSSDDARSFHDHPWWFLTLVLCGAYVDVSPTGRDPLRIGSIRFRRANHRHTVEVKRPGTWTLVITGRAVRRWGFWINGRLLKRDKYFAVHGHHPCNGQQPVRMKPDGTKIKG